MHTAGMKLVKRMVKAYILGTDLKRPAEPAASDTWYLEPEVARVVRPGWASIRAWEAPLLKELTEATNHCSGPIIEVGTLLGTTTSWLSVWNGGARKVITVDNYCWNPWGYRRDDHLALARQVLHYLVQTGRVEQVDMDKARFYQEYRGPAPSLLFLDAIHDYPETKKDIEWAKSVNAGVIAGHDYCDTFPGVIQAVDEFGGPRKLMGSIWCL